MSSGGGGDLDREPLLVRLQNPVTKTHTTVTKTRTSSP
jgi:hypothetical protein